MTVSVENKADVHWWSCEHFSRELTILSDGRITTCCVDDEGKNSFANIFEHDIHQVAILHRNFKRRYVDIQIGSAVDRSSCPSCVECLRDPKVRPYMRPKTIDEQTAFVDPLFYPDQLVLEITARCNAVCRTCIHNQLDNDLSSVRTGPSGLDLNLERTLEFLTPLAERLKTLRIYNYGEPFLHKKIDYFCRTLSDLSPGVNISISTNGTAFGSDERIQRILDSGIGSIIVSLHGGSEAIARKYMGERFQFSKTVDNVMRFMNAKKALGRQRPLINLKCVLFSWNDSDDEMESFRSLAHLLGVDAYHFWPTGGSIGTKRFPPGSQAWQELVDAGRDCGGLHKETLRIG